MIKDTGFAKLKAYESAYKLAMEIFQVSKSFPKEETYSLTDQIRRSSRSICANFAEGYRKRVYEKHFVSTLTDCDAECSETMVWISFAKDCGYLNEKSAMNLFDRYVEVGNLLGYMISNPKKFMPK
jgi:four helix bundle protein